MGKATCAECNADGVEVRPVPSGCLVCLLCLSTYSSKWRPKTAAAQQEWKKKMDERKRDPEYVRDIAKDHFLKGVPENSDAYASAMRAVDLVGKPRSEYKCNHVILEACGLPRNLGPISKIASSEEFVDIKEQELQPGDVIIFKKSPTDDTLNHGAVYMGSRNGMKYFVHSPNSGVMFGMTTDYARRNSPETWGDLIVGYRRRKKAGGS